jgi:hypothetical protein
MAENAIDKILEEKKRAAAPVAAAEPGQEDKFFSILGGEGLHEEFIEFRMRTGNLICFSYSDLLWFNYDPQAGCIDLEIGGFLINIKGRGLVPKLWQGIKSKRVAWIKEADTELQDHKDNENFILEILITPPSTGEESGAEETPA